MDTLIKCVNDLLAAFSNAGIRLVIGGGYGLFLRLTQMPDTGIQTVLRREAWPTVRSTNDIDVFITLEVITDAKSSSAVRKVLDNLGCKEIDSAKFWQFTFPGRKNLEDQDVKIDLLTGPVPEVKRSKVKIRDQRVRPVQKPEPPLHARQTPEAHFIERTIPIEISRNTDVGIEIIGTIHIPIPYTYLLMKLKAFEDRINDEEDQFGARHAADIFLIISTMTFTEFQTTQKLVAENIDVAAVQDAIRIFKAHFQKDDGNGLLKILQAHNLTLQNENFQLFRQALRQLLDK